MDNQICVLLLQFVLFYEYDNSDDIKKDYGQVFSDEDNKLWNIMCERN